MSFIETVFHAPPRPAMAALITAMGRLPRRQRIDIIKHRLKAAAAKQPRIRVLTHQAAAEARRIAAEVRR
jgi:hypothetical protein